MTQPLRQRPHPLLLEIAVRPWLERLSRAAGHRVRFAEVPDAELAGIRARGFDGVWLMGVWPTGPKARRLALGHPDLLRAYETLLPGWEPRDVAGSPYSISAYEPLAAAGGREGLRRLRERLRDHGLGLILDFVPNHMGIDHPWLDDHPDRFVRGTARDLARDPGNWFVHTTPSGEDRVFAHGRDPYFPGWSDTVQVDYRRREAREAMTAVLCDVASLADGIRCDVAMLPLSDVFERTWGAASPAGPWEFWPEAIGTLRRSTPDVVLMAEVYWGLGARLRGVGFDWVYDKELLDDVLANDRPALRARVSAPAAEHAGFVRFLENHDEPRAIEALGPRERAAAVLAWGLPGIRFVFDGQAEGARGRMPIQLARNPDPIRDEERAAFYAGLLRFLDDPVVHTGAWSALGEPADDGPAAALFGSRWGAASGARILLANLGDVDYAGALRWTSPAPETATTWTDVPTGQHFTSTVNDETQVVLELQVPALGVRLLRSGD